MLLMGGGKQVLRISCFFFFRKNSSGICNSEIELYYQRSEYQRSEYQRSEYQRSKYQRSVREANTTYISVTRQSHISFSGCSSTIMVTWFSISCGFVIPMHSIVALTGILNPSDVLMQSTLVLQ